MQLRTEITVEKVQPQLTHANRILLIGSCFSENIGKKLAYAGFEVDLNPFGIQFNPLTLASALRDLKNNRRFYENDLIEHNGMFHSFAHHSSFSWSNAEQTLARINDRLEVSNLAQSDTIIITWGSSFVYKHVKSDRLVANCHKIPQAQFEKMFIAKEDIIAAYVDIIAAYPNKQFILTVSPVRHMKDGAVNNSKSKANLILAAHELADKFGNVHYFPAYELVVDDLRDYRFFNDDMLHPNETAVNYIWKKFVEAAIDNSAFALMEKYTALNKAREHVFISDNKDERAKHEAYISKIEGEIEALKKA